jgi:hypothetical protein
MNPTDVVNICISLCNPERYADAIDEALDECQETPGLIRVVEVDRQDLPGVVALVIRYLDMIGELDLERAKRQVEGRTIRTDPPFGLNTPPIPLRNGSWICIAESRPDGSYQGKN